jgi:hypothetical protein
VLTYDKASAEDEKKKEQAEKDREEAVLRK